MSNPLSSLILRPTAFQSTETALDRTFFLDIEYTYIYKIYVWVLQKDRYSHNVQPASLSFYIAEAVHGNRRSVTRALCRIAGRSFWMRCKGEFMKTNVVSFRSNARLVRQLWGEPSRMAFRALRELTAKYSLSVAAGDLQFLDGRWYVTHSGLLQLASRRGCHGIKTNLQDKFSDLTAGRWVFKAVVYKSGLSRGFVGYGDADP